MMINFNHKYKKNPTQTHKKQQQRNKNMKRLRSSILYKNGELVEELSAGDQN